MYRRKPDGILWEGGSRKPGGPSGLNACPATMARSSLAE